MNHQMPPYIRFVQNYSEKHDQHYTELLTQPYFMQYVILNDEVQTHEAVEPNRLRALGGDHIHQMFDRIHVNNPSTVIEIMLQQRAHEDGFVILMDDWNNSWVYIPSHANRYEQWEYDGLENGPRSNQIFV
jgi:S-adenosylmethionine:diacylglycerol 3-amino-3-carboxypropyl transferase